MGVDAGALEVVSRARLRAGDDYVLVFCVLKELNHSDEFSVRETGSGVQVVERRVRSIKPKEGRVDWSILMTTNFRRNENRP